LTPAADIYSLAKTAYTLITGTGPRAFAHEPITFLPEPISAESWAPSIARVLERATQTRAADRYQTVADFWDELHEAALPATQPLIYGRPEPVSSDLSVEAEVLTEAAPPRPRFETSKELQHPQVGNGASRPRIVVPIAGRPAMTAPPGFVMPAPHPGGRVTVSVPANGVANGLANEAARASAGGGRLVTKPRKRSRDFVVGLVLVLCFAGLLVATGAYVRSVIRGQPTQQTTTTPSIVGHEAVTITDLNLRSGPNATNDQIGLAESGSRVRVLSVSSNPGWCEVQVLQHGRPKDDQSTADRGWVNKRFLKFD
jgi:hypothetical protein